MIVYIYVILNLASIQMQINVPKDTCTYVCLYILYITYILLLYIIYIYIIYYIYIYCRIASISLLRVKVLYFLYNIATA